MEKYKKQIIKDPEYSTALSLDEFFIKAQAYSVEHYRSTVNHFVALKYGDIGPFQFFQEYIWCCYVAGFNARVVTGHYTSLIEAYEIGDYNLINEATWDKVKPIIASRRKFEAIRKTAQLLRTMAWEDFSETYLMTIDKIGKLPFMGPVMRHHLARNIGHDTVKPDLHMERLADHYKYGSPYMMCMLLSDKYNVRIGVVDLMLWFYTSIHGTTHLAKANV